MKRSFYLLILFCSLSFYSLAQCWLKVSAGPIHTLAIKTDGTLWAWGNNSFGQLGTGDNTERRYPVKLGNATDWTDISAGYTHSVARKSNGTLWAWGANGQGQLGDGTNSPSTTPVQLPGNDWSRFSAGGEYTLAVRTDGTLWSWGVNNFGQLGDGSTSNSNTPIQIGSATNWSTPCAASESQAVLKTDGTIWTWGTNLTGEMGTGNNTPSQVPVQMGTDNDWAFLSNGGTNMLAIKTNGTLWSWGLNNYGQLGDGTTTTRNSPVQTGTDNDWTKAGTGNCTIAVKTDGSLWAWGDNGSGQAGNNTFGNQNQPVQTGFLATDWEAVSTNGFSVFGLRTGNGLWGWGINNAYQLGDGTTTERRAPVAVTCLTILPVTGLKLTGKIQEGNAVIGWSTETETNSSHFEIEHSVDGVLFTKAGTVGAKGGNSRTEYSFVHRNPAPGKNYYRLKQVDLDGKSVYSAVVVVSNDKGMLITVAPNPVVDYVTISLGREAGFRTISLINTNGQVLWKQNMNVGSNSVRVYMGGMARGVYYVVGGKEVRKVIKL